MRLIHRDGGCVVCKAAGLPNASFDYEDLTDYFEGAHIIRIPYYDIVSHKFRGSPSRN